MNRFTTTDRLNTLIFEDDSCKIYCTVTDFRDPTWWIGINKIIDKIKNESYPPFKSNKELEIYQRIILDLGNKDGIKEIVTSKFGFIKYEEVKLLEKQFEQPLLY